MDIDFRRLATSVSIVCLYVFSLCPSQENPRYHHCFGDEDMVGRMLVLAKAGHASTVVQTSMTLYWIGLCRRVTVFSPGSEVYV